MANRKRQSEKRQRGLMITDAVIGIGLLGTLLAIVAVTLGHDLRAKRAATEHRQLTFAAEAALLDLRSGWQGRTDELEDGHEIEMTIASDTDAPEGQVWVRIVSRKERQSVELYGLVKAEAMDQEAQR